MAEDDRLPDDALVVRCGLPPFANSPLNQGCDWHQDGHFGFSVQASVGLTVQDLARAFYNKSVGFTTVGKIRTLGYDVVRTSGEAYHATVIVPLNWRVDDALTLTRIFQTANNPAPKKRR